MDETQTTMITKLPRARLVDRIPYLQSRAENRRVVHVGFADAGYRTLQRETDAWLHGHLDEVAKELVGIDLDAVGVAEAEQEGFEAYVADCTRPDEVQRLGIERADVVIAGEIIEHLDDPGGFLDAMHALVGPDGSLVLTTPNAYGWLNPAAVLSGYEVNHPDHVLMFTCGTLSKMLARHGWTVAEVRYYVPSVKELQGSGLRMLVLGLGARSILWVQRSLGRLGIPYVCDGLIVVARSA